MTTQPFTPEEIHTVQRAWSRLWWAALIQGVIAIGFGLYTVFNPGQSPTAVVEILGLFIIIDGVIDVIAAFVERKQLPRWGSQALTGLFVIIAGFAVIGLAEFIANVALAILIFIIAFAFFISGVYSVYKSLHLRKQGGINWGRFIVGVLKLFFAVILFTQTKASATVLLWVIGVFLLLLGAGLVFLAFRLRSMGRYIAPAMKNDVVDAHLVGDEIVVDGDQADAPPAEVKELPDRVD
jgi:uncharacterized membrane protein HdeD (DUF308 family)